MQKKRTSTGSRSKKTTAKKRTSTKRTYKKGKVSIPAYKVIILCAGIIAVCMLLLLVTNLPETNHTGEPSEIAQRFEPNKPSDKADIPTVSKKKTSRQSKDYTEGKSSKKQTQTATVKKDEPKKSSEKTKTKPAEKNSTPASKTADLKPPAENSKVAAKEIKSEETKNSSDKNSSQNKSTSTTKTETPAASVSTKVPVTENTTTSSTTQVPSSKSFDFPSATPKAQLIFVFDDGGQNMSQLEKFMDLPFPITVAVLPQLANSSVAAERVRKSGNEVILHQPMQSINANVNPGPGAITPDMNEAQIISQLFININQIGPVAGMNNHEGSAITADADTMALILQTASENGIYFLDSRTNVETKVPYVAGELGYSYYERNIFLDNVKTRENVLSELNKGLAIANKTGTAIMIGHIWSADYLPALLKEVYPELKAKGYTFSTVSKSNALKN